MNQSKEVAAAIDAIRRGKAESEEKANADMQADKVPEWLRGRVEGTVMTGREQVLSYAHRATMQDRNKSYGNPEDNFQNIANLWNSYLQAQGHGNVELQSYDVAQFMILVKVARLANNPTHIDSLVDIAGYAACGGDIVINCSIGAISGI